MERENHPFLNGKPSSTSPFLGSMLVFRGALSFSLSFEYAAWSCWIWSYPLLSFCVCETNTSWWFQPLWKTLVKMGSSSPIFGVRIPKHIWVATTQNSMKGWLELLKAVTFVKWRQPFHDYNAAFLRPWSLLWSRGVELPFHTEILEISLLHGCRNPVRKPPGMVLKPYT